MKKLINFLLILGSLSCSHFDEIAPGSTQALQINSSEEAGKRFITNLIFSVPNNYNPKNSSPLLVALHGTGSNAAAFHDLFKPVTQELGFVLLTPQGSKMTDANFGWTWGFNAERSIMNSIDYIRNTVNIDIFQIYILGFSSGGSLAWNIGLEYPHNFAGIVPLCCTIGPKRLSAANFNQKFYLAHGQLESSLQDPYSNIVNILEKNSSDSKYVIYPDVGHTLPEPKEDEIRKILMFLKK